MFLVSKKIDNAFACRMIFFVVAFYVGLWTIRIPTIKEQVGTDKKLQDIVSQLEDVYTYRKNIKFKIKDNPFDLSRVISSDSNGKGRRSKLWVSGIVNKPNGTNMAILNYMNKSINVVAGDSIAGGVIEHITTTTVTYMKNEQLYYFDLGVGNNIE